MNLDIYTLVTNIGKAKIANATVTGSKVDFLKLKVGDGNGSYYEPSESQTDLVHTVWEGNVNNVLTGGENNPNWIIVQTVIPPGEGGFYVREAGIFDNDDNLLAISKYPESYKPSMEDGSTDDLTIELIFEVSNASIINLKIDPLVTTASMKDLNNLEAKINTQLKDIAKKTDKFTEDSNG
ncbi:MULTISPECIES: phage tail protein, partial [unclassified Clostridium]|uniref:phage tail protein n=2 Tax=Clostridium TaxID=1485 RepID=UPI00207AC0C6